MHVVEVGAESHRLAGTGFFVSMLVGSLFDYLKDSFDALYREGDPSGLDAPVCAASPIVL